MRLLAIAIAMASLLGCGPSDGADDGGPVDDAGAPMDTGTDTSAFDSGAVDGGSDGGGTIEDTLAAHRERLFAGYAGTADRCAAWAAMDQSQRAVFDTLTHRLYLSRTPDGASMLSHIDRLVLIRGGGSDGRACGSAENNRLFLSMDAYLWGLMVDAWNGTDAIDDGAGGAWSRTGDLAGPHDPFDASDETTMGLRCLLLIEQSGSRPPTAQAHFFLEGSATRVERGADISLEADPHMLEIDHDFDCLHRSNPLCPGTDFEDRYRTNYGDFACEWLPSDCIPSVPDCYPGAVL